MNSKDNIKQHLIDLIYGELNADEEAKIRALIEADEDLQKEYEALKDVRKQLGKLTIEKNIEEPVFVLPTQNKNERNSTLHFIKPKSRMAKFMYSSVAVLIALVIVASVFGVKLTVASNSIQLAFGKTEMQEDNFTRAEVETIISEIQKENLILVDKLVSDLQKEQNELIQNSLTEFANYMDTQRSNDLAYFTLGMADLQQNTFSKFEETDFVLGEIIKTVSTNNE